MSADVVLKELKAKKYKPIYFLQGEETYFIDQISDYIEDNILNEAERGFNQSIFYGEDSDVQSIINSAKRFPMMSEYQVIIVKEAQRLKGIEKFESYFENPQPQTILCICYKEKKLDGRKKTGKIVAKNGVLVTLDRIKEEKVSAWITNYIQNKGFKIQPQVSQLMSECLGNKLSVVSNELDKLIISLNEGEDITAQTVEKNIGISKDYNVFELNKAIGLRDKVKVYQIVDYMVKHEKANPFLMILGAMNSYFSKIMLAHYSPDKSSAGIARVIGIPPFFAGEYLTAMKHYNLERISKVYDLLYTYNARNNGYENANTSSGDLLREMTFKVLNC
ncbi:MAG: DNA polymerase-3 subunit delta [Sphingobacteriales bacterium]|jgi:DNA polymerase-3 subunit delta